MKFSKVRLPLVVKILLIILPVTIILIVAGKILRHSSPYFSTHCLEYKQKDYSRKLNDRIVDYSAEAKQKGIKVCRDEKELRSRISDGSLVRVRSGNRYVIDVMKYSSPYITKDGKMLLDEIGRRFNEKVSKEGVRGARFIVTSMTRKSDDLKSLRRNNRNSSANSPHLYGNAFDLSYKRITARKWILTECDKKFLKDALGEVIWQLREEKKCWATYERMQNCFHVVAR
jgi:hypothetical protein